MSTSQDLAERNSRNGSQSNREKLYKRFQKLNAQEPAILQTRSQKQLGYDIISQNQQSDQNEKPIHTNSMRHGQKGVPQRSDLKADYINTTNNICISPKGNMKERVRRVSNMPQQPPSKPQMTPANAGLGNLSNFRHSKAYEMPFKQHKVIKNQKGGVQKTAYSQNQQIVAQRRQQFRPPYTKSRNQGRAAISTSSVNYDGSYSSNNIPLNMTLEEHLTSVSGRALKSCNIRSNEQRQSSKGELTNEISSGNPKNLVSTNTYGDFNSNQHQQLLQERYFSQSSEQSSYYPIQMQALKKMALTNKPSQAEIAVESQVRDHLIRGATGQDERNNHQTISLQSDIDLNPLNDSHMFHISNYLRSKHQPQKVNHNQSSSTQQEPGNYSNFYPVGEDMTQSDSSLWLNEELNAFNQGKYESRQIEQFYEHQGSATRYHQGTGTDFLPDNKNITFHQKLQKNAQQLGQLQLHTQNTENSHRPTSKRQVGVEQQSQADQRFQQVQYGVDLNQQPQNGKNSGLTQLQRHFITQKTAPQLSHRSYPVNNSASHQVAYNTGRLSHQPGGFGQSQVSRDSNSMSISYQGHLPSQTFKNQLRLSVISDDDLKNRNSEGGYPIKTNNQLNNQSSNRIPLNLQQKQQFIDPNRSYQDFTKCSIRTNPYGYLLSSNYVGSTAPSATIDQLAVSQDNSCSQLYPGNFTIATATLPTGYEVPNTLIGGSTMAANSLEGFAARVDHNKSDKISGNQSRQRCQAKSVETLEKEYTNQVAQSLLAQVKPGILKLITSKIEAIVQELCEEGFCDQGTIMRVLEHRASKLFPENLLSGVGETNFDQNIDQQRVFQSGDDRSLSAKTGNDSRGNPMMFNSQINLSNNEMNNLGRSVCSETMLNQPQRNQRQQQLTLRNLVENSPETSDLRSDNLSFKMQLIAQQEREAHYQNQNIRGSEDVIGQFTNLNTTEKIINQIQRQFQSEATELNKETAEGVDNSPLNNEYDDYPQRDQLSNEYLINDLLAEHEKTMQNRNFKSRKPHKSDDFKITFAHISKNSSENMVEQPRQEQDLQLKQENLISFNPNDNADLQSPILNDNKIVIENIRNFNQAKMQLDATNSQKKFSANTRPEFLPFDPQQTSRQSQRQGSSFPGRQIQSQAINGTAKQENFLLATEKFTAPEDTQQMMGQMQTAETEEERLASTAEYNRELQKEIAQLYFQSTAGQAPSLNLFAQTNQEEKKSRNERPSNFGRYTVNTQQPQKSDTRLQKFQTGTLSSKISNKLYTRTMTSDPSSDAYRHHMTHNSDLIEQIGNQFTADVHSQQFLINTAPQVVQQLTLSSQEATSRDLQRAIAAQNIMRNMSGERGYSHYQTQQPPQPILQEAKVQSLASNTSETTQDQQTLMSLPSLQRSQSKSNNINQNMTVQQPTERLECPSQKCYLRSSRPVSNTSNQATEQQTKNSQYDVRAEGSIINIKRNTNGDPEMLILSSQKEIKDLMSTQTSNMHLPKQKKARSRSQSKQSMWPKSQRVAKSLKSTASHSRSRRATNQLRNMIPFHDKVVEKTRSTQNLTSQTKSQKQSTNLFMKMKASQLPKVLLRGQNNDCSQRLGIRHGNLISINENNGTQLRLQSPESPKSPFTKKTKTQSARMRRQAVPVSTFSSRTPQQRRGFIQHQKNQESKRPQSALNNLSETKSKGFEKSAVTTRSVNNCALEQDFLKSIKHLRKENYATKKDLQALYRHKLEKLKGTLLEEKKKSENEIKEKLKFAQHAANLQRQRANNFKTVANEFAGIAQSERQKKEELIQRLSMQQFRQSKRVSQTQIGRLSRSLSYRRGGSQFSGSLNPLINEKPRQRFRAVLGSTYKPGFSFLSTSMPRNNHNFVKGVFEGGLPKAVKPKGYFLRDCCPEKRSVVVNGNLDSSMERIEKLVRRQDSTTHKDSKLINDDQTLCRNQKLEDKENSVIVVHKQLNFDKHGSQGGEEKKQTFGLDKNSQLQTIGSPRTFTGTLGAQKSLFDPTKTIHTSDEGHKTPVRNKSNSDKANKTLIADLQRSGVRFKCTSCKESKVQILVPCAKCLSINCNADQKKLGRDKSPVSDVSWDSSDLNSEYRQHPATRDKNVFSSRLLKCSNDLIVNQARLDQIQKILFQPKQPRQGGQKSVSMQRQKGRESQCELDQGTLPQMIDRLRKSRQNLKF